MALKTVIHFVYTPDDSVFFLLRHPVPTFDAAAPVTRCRSSGWLQQFESVVVVGGGASEQKDGSCCRRRSETSHALH